MDETNITLVVLAAGLGSRYGGMKQLDGVGPRGETIMEYSVYDAIRAGIRRVIFVIKGEMRDTFDAAIGQKLSPFCQIEYAFQRLDDLPEGFSVPANRIKPWGTAHAVRSCRKQLDGPFIVINADDYYGTDAFAEMAKFLSLNQTDLNMPQFAMLGYEVAKTLSEHGSVARGVCEVNPDGYLLRVTERTRIERKSGVVKYTDEMGRTHSLADTTPVSMNIWGLTPAFLDALETYFVNFLRDERNHERNEIYLPGYVQHLIDHNAARVAVLPIGERWFGVTYREDRDGVVSALAEMTAEGKYPSGLWSYDDKRD